MAELLLLLPACQRSKITQLHHASNTAATGGGTFAVDQDITQSASKVRMPRYSKTKLFFYSAAGIVGCYLIYRGVKWYNRKQKAATLPEPNQPYVAPPKAITHDDIQKEFERAFPDQAGQEIQNEETFSLQEQEFIYYTGYGWMINDGRKPTKPEPAYGCPKNYRNSQTYICKENNFMGKSRRKVYSNESSDEDIPENEVEENLTQLERGTCPAVPPNTVAFPVQRRHSDFLTHKFVEETIHQENLIQPQPGDVLQIAEERAPRSAGYYIFGEAALWWRIRSTGT